MSRSPARDIEIIRGPVLRASGRAGKRYGSSKPEEAPPEEATSPSLDPAAPEPVADRGDGGSDVP